MKEADSFIQELENTKEIRQKTFNEDAHTFTSTPRLKNMISRNAFVLWTLNSSFLLRFKFIHHCTAKEIVFNFILVSDFSTNFCVFVCVWKFWRTVLESSQNAIYVASLKCCCKWNVLLISRRETKFHILYYVVTYLSVKCSFWGWFVKWYCLFLSGFLL